MKNLVATAMSYEGVGGGFRDEPELLQFATERYVEAEASAVDLETDGLKGPLFRRLVGH